jgi:hypothetical protein
MVDFGTILKRGKRRAMAKKDVGHWGNCDSCDERRLLHNYGDNDDKSWKLCEDCTNSFVKEELE